LPQLIVISDIYDGPEPDGCFSKLIAAKFGWTIKRIKLADLAGKEQLIGEALHEHLVQRTGFKRAARSLAKITTPEDVVLGYSAGGTVGYLSAEINSSFAGLICISSTRLREQNSAALEIPCMAIFGENDPGAPAAKWSRASHLTRIDLPSQAHAFYAIADEGWDQAYAHIEQFISNIILKSARG